VRIGPVFGDAVKLLICLRNDRGVEVGVGVEQLLPVPRRQVDIVDDLCVGQAFALIAVTEIDRADRNAGFTHRLRKGDIAEIDELGGSGRQRRHHHADKCQANCPLDQFCDCHS
jgi:hypothetical protein